MIANNIVLSPRASTQLRMRSFYNNFTLLPCGTPAEWDRQLKEFDPELSLRLNPQTETWLIFYDHHGQLSVIRSFGVQESFGKAFLNVKHNSILSLRKLRRMRAAEKDAEEDRVSSAINECSEEFGKDLHTMTKSKVSTDSVKDNDY